ncbi:erythroid membrane-associated protein-like [Polypterus senegalus]|uniref:erythroid membrane-associated protein-like n=1 Tax=Polypterus senegalus TaxID=55291 RepID=UPI00196307F6|nr:erythroid membrane-associated protein-like [Polypterus senegalus]
MAHVIIHSVTPLSSSAENSQRVTNAEWRRICSSTADVTFDPETAHPLLIVSKDGKEVRLGDTQQRVTDNPKRFDYCINVLARKGIHLRETLLGSGGRGEDGLEFRSHQRVSRSRKGGIILNPYFGYWTVWLKNENKYTANIDHPVLLPLRVKPWTVGVFLDYDEGQVSFYNAQSRSHLYTFTDTLYPFFNPELNHGGKNAAPVHTLTPQHTDHSELIICQYLCLVRAAQSQWRLSLTFSPPNSKPP